MVHEAAPDLACWIRLAGAGRSNSSAVTTGRDSGAGWSWLE